MCNKLKKRKTNLLKMDIKLMNLFIKTSTLATFFVIAKNKLLQQKYLFNRVSVFLSILVIAYESLKQKKQQLKHTSSFGHFNTY